MSRRVAAVDLGTNSTRLLVADVDGTRITEIERLLRITRLGDGVDASHRLDAAAAERVHATLAEYAARARELGADRLLAVATSAVRDAADGAAFLAEAAHRHGIETRLLSGAEEAALTFAGVTSRTPAAPGTLVCDVGGGSTELVVGGPAGVEAAASVDIGCVRLSERHLRSDPPTPTELDELRREAAAALPGDILAAARSVTGVAGTVTTLATIDLGLEHEVPALIDGHELAAATIEGELGRLAKMPLARRRRVRGLMPERAATIVAGAAILAEVVAAAGAAYVTVSERDILHGAALAAAA
jgi:exopolyphosphatase / guanosine-5'-triphosphate,3'-diphosphate pyrophosphatase